MNKTANMILCCVVVGPVLALVLLGSLERGGTSAFVFIISSILTAMFCCHQTQGTGLSGVVNCFVRALNDEECSIEVLSSTRLYSKSNGWIIDLKTKTASNERQLGHHMVRLSTMEALRLSYNVGRYLAKNQKLL